MNERDLKAWAQGALGLFLIMTAFGAIAVFGAKAAYEQERHKPYSDWDDEWA